MKNLEVLYDEETIQKRIKEMAKEIDDFYNGKQITAICVLKGAVYFAIDLTKKMNSTIDLDFIRIKSYDGKETTQNIQLKVDIDKDLENKDVLIIEDIIDTGFSLDFLRKYILSKNPNSLKIAVLCDKKERRKVDVPVDFVGFEIPNKFLVGYGFDDEDLYRNLPFIGSVN